MMGRWMTSLSLVCWSRRLGMDGSVWRCEPARLETTDQCGHDVFGSVPTPFSFSGGPFFVRKWVSILLFDFMSSCFTLYGETPEPTQRFPPRGGWLPILNAPPVRVLPVAFFVSFPARSPGTATVYHALISVWMWDRQTSCMTTRQDRLQRKCHDGRSSAPRQDGRTWTYSRTCPSLAEKAY